MEKIEDGKEKAKSWELIAQCEGGFWKDEIPCGDTYKLTEHDLVVQTVCVMGENEMEVIGFTCPGCGSFTEMEVGDIPVDIRKRVLGKHRENNRLVKRSFKNWLKRIFG